MGQGIFDEEIHEAIRRMMGFKAPSLEGLQTIFHQSQWSIAGLALCDLIHMMEDNIGDIADVNETFIMFILKVDNVTFSKHMRPIGLCNVSYKVLTKVLAHSLKTVMETWLAPNQCSFVPQTYSSVNIIIT